MHTNDSSLQQTAGNWTQAHTEENTGRFVLFCIVCSIVLCSPSDFVVVGNSGAGATIFLTEALIWPFTFCVVAWEAVTFRANTLQEGFAAVPMLFFYVVVCLLSTLMALGLDGSSDTIGKFKNLLPGFLLFLVTLRFVRSQKQINTILTVAFVGLIANAILAILQYKTGDYYFITPLKENEYKADPFGQVLKNTGNGLFTTANALGTMLIPAFIFSVSFVFRALFARSSQKAIMWLLSANCIGFGLAFSYNKGAVIWSLIGLAVSISSFRRKFWMIVGSVTIGIAAFAFFGSFGLADPGSIALDTLLVRIRIWRATFQVLEDWPSVIWYGDGLRYMSYMNATIADWSFPSSHNTWLDQILMFGMPGVSLYLLLWISIINKITYCIVVSDGVTLTVCNCLAGCLTAIAGESFFEPRADNVTPVVQVFLLFALVACQSRVVSSNLRGNTMSPGERIGTSVFGT